jgi:hypothetical protein
MQSNLLENMKLWQYGNVPNSHIPLFYAEHSDENAECVHADMQNNMQENMRLWQYGNMQNPHILLCQCCPAAGTVSTGPFPLPPSPFPLPPSPSPSPYSPFSFTSWTAVQLFLEWF